MVNEFGEGNQQIDTASCVSLLYETLCALADEVATLSAVIEQFERLPGMRQRASS